MLRMGLLCSCVTVMTACESGSNGELTLDRAQRALDAFAQQHLHNDPFTEEQIRSGNFGSTITDGQITAEGIVGSGEGPSVEVTISYEAHNQVISIYGQFSEYDSECNSTAEFIRYSDGRWVLNSIELSTAWDNLQIPVP